MATRRATVIGVFTGADKAQSAIDDLRRAGFRNDQIGLVARSSAESPTVSGVSGHDHHKERTDLPHGAAHSQWEQGAGVGAAAGAATGAGLGLAVAAGLIPGAGPIIAGGTLAAILASTGTGAVVGTILGGLVGLGVPEQEAAYYDNEFKSGRTIVTVQADERATDAWDVLMRHGAYDVERRPIPTAVAGTDLEATPY
jgi:hypothetical protein